METKTTTSNYSKTLSNKIIEESRKQFGVVLHIILAPDGMWMVVPSGSSKAIKKLNTKRMAVTFALKKLKTSSYSQIFVHDKHGQLNEVLTG